MDKIFFLDGIKALIRRESVITDGRVFRLHYKFTATVLIIFTLLVTSTQFFGDPIMCMDVKAAPQAVINTYCWIEATFTLPRALTYRIGHDVAAPGVQHYSGVEKDEVVEHAYYQWVCFVFLLQALCFYASKIFWSSKEGGRIENLILKLDNPIIPKADKEANINQLVKYFKANLHKHTEYVLGYVGAETFNFAHVVLQIVFLDKFLGGEFSNYGHKVLQYLNMDQDARYDPMIKVFPLVTKCSFHTYGASGDVQKYDTMCVLPINVLNSKLFVFLWFWFVILAILSGLSMLYHLVQLLSYRFRYILLHTTNRLTPKEALDTVLTKFAYGDWFILYRLSANLDHIHSRDLLLALAENFKENNLKNGLSDADSEETETLLKKPDAMAATKLAPSESEC